MFEVTGWQRPIISNLRGGCRKGSIFDNHPQNPSLPFLICEHRFCRDCIEDMKGGQDCPIHHCRGKNVDNFNWMKNLA